LHDPYRQAIRAKGNHVDQLHLIRTFVAVVDANGFAGGARALRASAPSVTRAVNELESQLGVRLLNRTTRVVRVTEPGAHYAEDCRRILADLDAANASVAGLHSTPTGLLTLTAPVLFGARYVTPIVTEYLRSFPDVSAECWYLDRVVNMMEDGIDIAVRIGELPDSSMQAVQVGRVRRVICGAPRYLEQRGIPNTPDDLQEHEIISANSIAPGAEWRLIRDEKPCIVKLRPRVTFSSNDGALAAAVDGFGLTRLLSYQIADYLQNGRLKVVLEDCEPPALPVHLVHREGRHASRKARAFLDLAVARLRANPALN